MSGYITESRPTGEINPSFVNISGATSPETLTTQTRQIFQSQQRTTSFRTRGGVSDEYDAELWTKVTRNGFLTTDPEFDRGHEFYTTRESARLSHPWWTGRTTRADMDGSQTLGYRGPLIPLTAVLPGTKLAYPAERRLSAGEISSFGKRAISNSAPTAPSTNLVVAMGELARDGIPSLPGERSLGRAPAIRGRRGSNEVPIYDQASDEFLNIAFGWAPLLSDAKKTVRSLQTATAQARQLVRDSGKIVRRTYRFPRERSITHSYAYPRNGSGTFVPFLNVTSSLMTRRTPEIEWDKMPEVLITTTLQRDVWFKGAFTYHVPDDKSVWGRIERYEQLANKLLGTRLSAEAAWNLAPWSWLVDWIADVGTILSNATRLSEDQLVLRYGYLMSHTVDEVHHTASNAVFKVGELTPVSAILRRESKERVRATPFGFGLNSADFTAKQWAILYALGMSKGDRRLM